MTSELYCINQENILNFIFFYVEFYKILLKKNDSIFMNSNRTVS